MKSLRDRLANLMHSCHNLPRALIWRRLMMRYGTVTLVHTPGKVGSSSIYEALRGARLPFVFHTHDLARDWQLNPENVTTRQRAARGKWGFPWTSHMTASAMLEPLIRRHFEEINWRLIVVIRDPVERNVSNYFQGLRSGIYLPGVSDRDVNAEDAFSDFMENYPHHRQEEWISKELAGTFGVDVLSADFDDSAGFRTYAASNVGVIVLRLETLMSIGQQGLRDFLEIPELSITRANEAQHLSHAGVYSELRTRVMSDPAYLVMMQSSTFARKFYPKTLDETRADSATERGE